MTQGEFRIEMDRLAKAFGVVLKADTLEAYWETLKDYPGIALRVAASEVIQDDDYHRMPIPAALARIMKRYMQDAPFSEDTHKVRRKLIERKLSLLEACVQTERVKIQQDRLREILVKDYPWKGEVPF
jgi:hypothetical protein